MINTLPTQTPKYRLILDKKRIFHKKHLEKNRDCEIQSIKNTRFLPRLNQQRANYINFITYFKFLDLIAPIFWVEC